MLSGELCNKEPGEGGKELVGVEERIEGETSIIIMIVITTVHPPVAILYSLPLPVRELQ